MAKSVRYMDVMAIRSSSKANKTHQLLVEPLVLPEMDHVDVEQTAEISDKCLFYPSGKKNKNLRQVHSLAQLFTGSFTQLPSHAASYTIP